MKIKALLTTVLVIMAFALTAQENLKKLPDVEVKTLEGERFNTSEIDNDGKPIILSFWATWCKPCIKELTIIDELYIDWQDETGVKFVAISIDDSRTMTKVKPMVYGNDWQYEVLLDVNQDFKRAMNVNMIPHTFLLNSEKEIVWQHTSFAEGGEFKLISLVRKLIKGEDISEE